jgi:hypothetical protein
MPVMHGLAEPGPACPLIRRISLDRHDDPLRAAAAGLSSQVAPLLHQSTASRSDQRSVIFRSACPAPLSVPDQSIAFTKRGQHDAPQAFQSAFPVGPFFAQYRLGI